MVSVVIDTILYFFIFYDGISKNEGNYIYFLPVRDEILARVLCVAEQ